MNDFHSLLSSCCMDDNTLRALLERWHGEKNQDRQNKLKQTILGIIEERERTNFIVRFLLRDYDSWHKVLTDAESKSSDAHDAKFYEPHLLAVLAQNGGKLEPIKAIQNVVERVKNELTLADFTMTSSKRFRYDTTIRFLANTLKKRNILSNAKEYKNKLWALAPKI